MTTKNDITGDGIKAENAAWSFSGETVPMFDKHVSKSVPLYAEGHKLILDISDYFISDNSRCLEIGCSTGVLIKQLAQHHNKKSNTSFVGLDVEKDMIVEANDRKEKHEKNLKYVHGDIVDFEIPSVDLAVAYYTIQFIRPALRQLIINKIYENLNWGGAFIMFEKVRGPDARFQDIFVGLYNEFKLQKGYSTDEIFNKTRSLKGILEPFSTQGNIEMLQRAGFKDITTISKFISFEGFLAIK